MASRGHILVVDDERAIRRLLRMYLTDAGFTVAEAPDGEQALEQVHARGIPIESALVRRATLEDVFLRLTGRTLVD